MTLKQKLGIAVTSIFLGGAAVFFYSESTVNKAFLSEAEQQSLSVINLDNKQLAVLSLPKLVFANVEIGNQKLISCEIQQHSPLTNAVELLMRLLIIGSFGSVSIVGSSSLMQRYFNVINREFILIFRYVILLLCVLVMSSIVMFLFSSTHPSYSGTCPRPKFLLVNQSGRFNSRTFF